MAFLSALGKVVPPPTRPRFILLALLTTLAGFLELVGVSLVIPFIAYAGKMKTFGLSNKALSWIVSWLQSIGVPSELLTVSLGGLFFLGIGLANLGLCLYQYYAFVVVYRHKAALSTWVAESLAQKPIGWYDQQNTADLSKSLMTDVSNCAEFLSAAVQVAGVGLRGLMVYLFFLWAQPRLALSVALGMTLSAWIVLRFIHRPLVRAGDRAYEMDRRMYRLSSELVAGARELRVTNTSERWVRQLRGAAELSVQPQVLRLMPGFATRGAMETLAVGSVILLLIYFNHKDGNLGNGLPMLSAYALAGIRLIPSVQQAIYFLVQMRFHVPAVVKVASILETSDWEADPVSREPVVFEKEIAFEGVDFRYEAERATLSDIHLKVCKRQRVAFVGETGAGKSTLVDILLGLRRPQSGSILVDQRPLQHEDISTLRELIGYVPQSIYLQDASIRENVAFGLGPGEIDEQKVRLACRAAAIADFIEQLPAGYQTEVGERGVRLSGGQCQRLGIARALYHDPEIVVFDEATSALDSSTESQVLEALETLKGVKTLVVIAHRLQTVWDFDCIYVLERGRIVASGTSAQLMEKSPIFQRLAGAQAQLSIATG